LLLFFVILNADLVNT